MTVAAPPLRVGLIGTGYWAATVHAPAIAAAASVELAGVWGRSADAARALAAQTGARGYDDVDALVEAVDIVEFAVPPDVQAPLAARAARAGRHLLLEKPIALDVESAEALVAAVTESGVAALVFLTGLYDPRIRVLLEQARSTGGWRGGHALYLGSALTDENPFNTPWRRVHGGLWDLAPHPISVLTAALGPVTAVRIDHGTRDLVHLVLHHEEGRTSTATVTLCAPEAADGFGAGIWGDAGRLDFPVDDIDSVDALRTALDELAELVRTGERSHPASLAVGRRIFGVQAAAAAGRTEPA